MICKNCGAVCEDGAKFCSVCGTDVSAATVPAQPAYQQPVQPVYQQPVYQQPVYQQPVYQHPVYQQPVQPAYQQPVYQQPVYQQPPVVPVVPGKGLGITAMVLGIVALVFFCYWVIAIPCAIIGAILGGVSLNKAKEVGAKNGMAVAGLTCSLIALGLAVLFLIMVAAGIAQLNIGFDGYYY